MVAANTRLRFRASQRAMKTQNKQGSFWKNTVKFFHFLVRTPNPILSSRAVFLDPLDEFKPPPKDRLVKSDRLRNDTEAVPHSPGFGIDAAGVSGFAAREEQTFVDLKILCHKIASGRSSACLSKGETKRNRREAWASCAEETEVLEKNREEFSRKKHRHPCQKCRCDSILSRCGSYGVKCQRQRCRLIFEFLVARASCRGEAFRRNGQERGVQRDVHMAFPPHFPAVFRHGKTCVGRAVLRSNKMCNEKTPR